MTPVDEDTVAVRPAVTGGQREDGPLNSVQQKWNVRCFQEQVTCKKGLDIKRGVIQETEKGKGVLDIVKGVGDRENLENSEKHKFVGVDFFQGNVWCAERREWKGNQIWQESVCQDEGDI